jgi:hypothetical protein
VSFLNALFLAGLAAAALPILIHLLSRQKAKRVLFGSVDFIRKLEEKRRRRLRLTQLLLLLLRVLLLVLIAIGFARPTLRRSLLGMGAGGQTSSVILLDTSASMGAARGGEVRQEAARERALAAADLIGGDDESALVAASALVGRAEPSLARSRDLVKQEIARVPTTAGASDVAAGVRAAAALLADARSPNRELFVISDFQKNARLEPDLASVLPPDTKVYLMPVLPAEDGNAAVTAATWREDRVGSGTIVVEAEVSRFGGQGALETVATLAIDGVERERRLVSVEPDEKQTVAFSVPIAERGYHRGEVSIDAPDLAVDNARPIVVQLARGLDVLILDGRGRSERASGYHVARALAPLPEVSTFFDVTHASASSGVPDLAPFGAVVLAEIGRLSQDEVDRIATYVNAGGGLLILPGRNLDAGFYNRDLLPRVGLPLRVETPPKEFGTSFARVDDVTEGHPIFAPFGDHQERLLRDTKVFRYLSLAPEAGVRAIARFGGGAPALVEADRADAGRVVMSAFPVETEWTTLPRDPAFLPLLHETMKHLTKGESQDAANVVVGAPYRRVLTDLETSAEITVVRPDGSEELVSPREDPAGLVAEVRDTDLPGFYTMRLPSGDVLFAAAVDPTESDLSVLGRDEIDEAFPGGQFVAPDAEIRRAVLAARFGREYWREVLLLALVLAVVEALAGRGGIRPSAAASGERRAA